MRDGGKKRLYGIEGLALDCGIHKDDRFPGVHCAVMQYLCGQGLSLPTGFGRLS